MGNLRWLINGAPFLLFSIHDGEGPTQPNPTQPGPTQPSPVSAIFWHTGLANSWLVSICHEIIRIPQRCHSAVPLAVSIFNVGENKVLRSACIQPICCWWSNGFMHLLLMSSPLMPIKARARCCFTKARIPFKVHHRAGVRACVCTRLGKLSHFKQVWLAVTVGAPFHIKTALQQKKIYIFFFLQKVDVFYFQALPVLHRVTFYSRLVAVNVCVLYISFFLFSPSSSSSSFLCSSESRWWTRRKMSQRRMGSGDDVCRC